MSFMFPGALPCKTMEEYLIQAKPHPAHHQLLINRVMQGLVAQMGCSVVLVHYVIDILLYTPSGILCLYMPVM